jgi:Zn-dependent peptidase ImmA (M78 family)
MAYPCRVADRVLDEVPVLVPEDLLLLNEIAWQRNARVVEAQLEGAEASALSVPGGRSVITVSSRIYSRERRRFSIAHELGHIEMHRTLPGVNLCLESDIDEGKARQSAEVELEASQFASCLLLPGRFVARRFTDVPSFEVIANVAREFETSLTATARRFIQFSEEPVAVVFAQGGQIRWFDATKAFHDCEIFVRVNEPVERDTSAGRMLRGVAAKKDGWVDTLALDWLREGGYRRDARIKEWSVHMPGLDAVVTLLWVDDSIDSEDSEDDDL